MNGIDFLRDAIVFLDCCNETFLERWTPEELIAIYRYSLSCHLLKGVPPEDWADNVLLDALSDSGCGERFAKVLVARCGGCGSDFCWTCNPDPERSCDGSCDPMCGWCNEQADIAAQWRHS